MAIAQNASLVVHEVDILNGGAAHNLMDNDSQAKEDARIRDGEFDITILPPSSSSWTRALFRLGGPLPCRDKTNLWGLPHALDNIRAKARQGNTCMHLTPSEPLKRSLRPSGSASSILRIAAAPQGGRPPVPVRG